MVQTDESRIDLFGKDMKISDYPKEKINIYSSEMSSETVESYEKYYKNLNESTSNKIQNDMHYDTEKIFDNNEHNDTETKLNVLMTSVNDSDRKRVRIEVAGTSADVLPNKKRKKEFEPPKLQEDNRDIFCWRCHKYVGFGEIISCYFCPRVFHLKCSHIQEKPSTFWLCTECDAISTAENPDKISPALSKLQKKDMAELLMYVLKRMRQHEGSSHFENRVDPESYPDYKDYIIKPMYLSLLEDNVKNMKYASCESFLADTKWMVHNSYIFNTVHSELTLYAKAMLKNAKHECEEIINCPDCYLHANTLAEDMWFIEPCDKPHVLVWARLKGFPYWPCKVMKANGTSVDVRFFGDHNKSLVPVDCCYLYSKQMPSKQKKVDELELAIKEAALHIKKLEEKYHVFQYASLKIQYNPKEEDEQRKLLLPYHDKPFFIKVKDKEKLLDPKIVRNIFEEPYPIFNCNNAHKGEEKNKTISDSPSEVGVNNEKNIIKNQNEGASSCIPSLVNRNVSPLNKPKIIIEENDSNILSRGSCGVPRQHIMRDYEKLNSSFIKNKSRKSTENEKHAVSGIIQESNYESDNVISFTKALNLTQKISNVQSNHFNNDKCQRNCLNSPEEKLRLHNFSKEDISAEKSENYEKNKISVHNTRNVRSLTNKSLDKSNNNPISDKLRISSNAKLINIITDNPALINNYIFKPMVVIQKLRDDIFRDYSKNYRKTEPMVANKLSTTNEKKSKKKSSSSPVENIGLNFDLLNGNITNLVSVTEIDLDKDESSKCNKLKSKEAEKTGISNTAQESNCLGSGDRPLKPVIKSENTEDEQLDNDYIEKLSKSILESTLDYSNDLENRNKNDFESNSAVENGFSEKISHLGIERSPYTEKEKVSHDIASNDQDPLGGNNEKETYEDSATFIPDNEDEINKAVNGNCNVDSKLFDKRSINQEVSNVTEKVDTNSVLSVENDVIVNEKTCIINLLENEVKIDSNVNKNVNNNLLENDKSHIPLQEVETVSEKIENANLIEGFENSEDISLIKNTECEIMSQDNSPQRDQIYSLGSKKCITVDENDDILNDNLKVKCLTKPELQSDVISNKKNLTTPHEDSDCEIVNIVFPSNCRKILKPIGYKRLKTSGGVIKKVFRSGMLLPTFKRRPNHNMTLKKMDFHNSPNKSRFYNNCSVNHARNFAATAGKSGYSRKISNLERGFEKSTNICITENVKIREEEKMMNLEIDTILSKVEKLDSKVTLLEMLREELKKFEDHCKKKVESYKNAYIEEMDALYTMEKQRWIQESMNVSENESKMMIDEIKKKQWCILCLNEAKFHCCWSTSYCSEKCQLADWPIHMKTCTQYTMRAGDPDLRISPDLKKIFRGELETIRDLKIKDIIDSLPDSHSQKNEAACSSLYNCNSANPTLALSNNSTNSTIISSRSSAAYISKKSSTKLEKSQDQYSGGLTSNSNSILFTVPLPNRNNALVSAGNGVHLNSGNTLNGNNHTVLMGGQRFILPKSFTKVIKKTVPIVAPNNVGCTQKDNQLKVKPFYITMPSTSLGDTSENAEGSLTNHLDTPIGTRILKLEQSKLLKESFDQNSLQKSDFTNSAQPYLIVEKSGESSHFTFRIGFQDGVEKVNILPSLVQRQTVTPLPYPVICDPSTSSDETVKTSASN